MKYIFKKLYVNIIICVLFFSLLFSCKKDKLEENTPTIYTKTLIYETKFDSIDNWQFATLVGNSNLDSAFAEIDSGTLTLYAQYSAHALASYDFTHLLPSISNNSFIVEIGFIYFDHKCSCNDECASVYGSDSYLDISFGNKKVSNCGGLRNLENDTLTIVILNNNINQVLINNKKSVTNSFGFFPRTNTVNENKIKFLVSSGYDNGEYLEVNFLRIYKID